MSYPQNHTGRNEFTSAKYWITILALLLLFFPFVFPSMSQLFIYTWDGQILLRILTHHADYLSHANCKRISHAFHLSTHAHKQTHQHFLIFSLQYFV